MLQALPKLTADHHRRGGAALAHTLALLRAQLRDHPTDDPPAYLTQRARNAVCFLERWPRLEWSAAWQHWQLAGKMPRYTGQLRLPGEDHASYWRVSGVRGPIMATAFSYHWDEATHAAALEFARAHGLHVEVQPADVPDMWFPGQTVPVIWSRAGLDWRQLGRFAAGAAGAAGGTASEPAALGATAAAGAAGAPQGVWGNGAAHTGPAASRGSR
jgi:hypothetical protein